MHKGKLRCNLEKIQINNGGITESWETNFQAITEFNECAASEWKSVKWKVELMYQMTDELAGTERE